MKIATVSRALAAFVFLLTSTSGWAATSIRIAFPLEGGNYTSTANLTANLEIGKIEESDAKIVMFQSRDNRWVKVNEIAVDAKLTGAQKFNLFSVYHFCEDVYAIRVMSGARTLAGPVHFKAGTGACWFGNSTKFVNLEHNLVDLAILKPTNQFSRDTCGAFASAAALEAAYKRLSGVNVLLSQNYIHHIIKSSFLMPTPLYQFENQSSFWGGNSTKDALSFLKSYTVPPASFAPYQDQPALRRILSDMGYAPFQWNANPTLVTTRQKHVDDLEYNEAHIPLLARQVANYGIASYQNQVGTGVSQISAIENFLRNGQEVVISMTLRWKRSPNKAKTMLYEPSGTGSHLMLIVGFDKTVDGDPYFLIKNSWGEGILRVHYDVIRNQSRVSWGVIDAVKDASLPNPSRWIGRWQMQHDRWRGTLILRRLWEVNLERLSGYVRMGEYQHQNGKSHCVYGQLDSSTRKLLLKINFDSTIENRTYDVVVQPNQPAVRTIARDVCPERASGQDFEFNMSVNTHRMANGKAYWNGMEFPAELTR